MFVSLETFPIARATLNNKLVRMSVCGQECLFCEQHNCRIYPDNRGIYWHFKVANYPAYILPAEINRAYLNREISIWDVYVYWRKHER